MPEETQQYYEEQLVDLQKQIDVLKERLEPDQLSKSIDRSYLSVGNLRAFLQILSLILTIFIAGAVYFGSVGLTNILKIREEAQKTEVIRQETENASSRVLKVGSQIESKVADVDKTLSKFEETTNNEISKLEQEVNKKIEEVDSRVRQVSVSMKNISEIFNKIAISQQSVLNAREQQLLTLLAKEIDPESAVFSFNAAHWALSFQRYDEALKYLEVTLDSPNTSLEILRRAKEMKDQALKLKEKPPKLQYQEARGVTIGPYGVVAFPVNILNILVKSGYLTVAQAQEVIDASKRKNN